MTAATIQTAEHNTTSLIREVHSESSERTYQGFFMVEQDFMKRYGGLLGPYGLGVYMALKTFANKKGECFPSQRTIAELVGMSRVQVSRELARLKEFGLIEIKSRYGEHGGQTSNLYILSAQTPVSGRNTPHISQMHPPVSDGYTPHIREIDKNNIYSNNIQHKQYRNQQQEKTKPSVSETNTAVVVALTDLGVSNKVANFLAEKYNTERITEKIAYLEFLQEAAPASIKNPCGWLRTAIVDDYARPDGFMPAEDRVGLETQRECQGVDTTEQLQAAQEAQEKRRKEQEARRRLLTGQYGTSPEDFAFWEQAKCEITYTTSAHISALTADMDILKVMGESVMVGVEREDTWRQLKHPNIQKAITRALSAVAERHIALQVVLLRV